MTRLRRHRATGFTGISHISSSARLEYKEKIRCKKPLSMGGAPPFSAGRQAPQATGSFTTSAGQFRVILIAAKNFVFLKTREPSLCLEKFP
jgi:hypothetical protein